jgi:hypothetical protein
MGKLGILYRHEDGKTTQVDTQAWDFSPWVKEKLSRAVRNQRLVREEPSEIERARIEAAIAAGEIQAPDVKAYISRRKAEALLDLLDEVERLGQVFLEGGLVVLQPKGIDPGELPTTRLDDDELSALAPRFA